MTELSTETVNASRKAHTIAFVDHIQTKKKQSHSTADGYRRCVNQFEKYVAGREGGYLTEWAKVDTAIAKAFLQNMALKERSARSINIMITSLRMFFDFLVLKGVVSANPFYDCRHLKPPAAEPPVLSDADILKLVRAPMCLWRDTVENDQPADSRARDFLDYRMVRDEAMIRIVFFAGLKTGEVVGFRDADFDRKESLVHIRKEGKCRCVFLVAPAATVLGKTIDLKTSLFVNTQEVFVNGKGQGLTARSIERIMKQHALSSGVRANISPRDLRRAFEWRLIKAGADECVVQYLLGHEDISTTTEFMVRMKIALDALNARIEGAAPGV